MNWKYVKKNVAQHKKQKEEEKNNEVKRIYFSFKNEKKEREKRRIYLFLRENKREIYSFSFAPDSFNSKANI